MFCSLPALVDPNNGPKMLITEADLEDYPGVFLWGSSDHSLHGKLAAYPLAIKIWDPWKITVPKRADYIAKTNGRRSYPWRVLIVAETDSKLLLSQMVYKLAKPSRIKDTSWIKPGKVSRDWWNANNIYGVDFKAGINTETYKYYIDFTAKYGIEYIILDAGWYDYVMLARKSAEQWYVGAMTDWTDRELTVDFSFLGPGRYTIEIYADGINADRYGNDYKKDTAEISVADKMKIKLAPGGGWAAIISPDVPCSR